VKLKGLAVILSAYDVQRDETLERCHSIWGTRKRAREEVLIATLAAHHGSGVRLRSYVAKLYWERA